MLTKKEFQTISPPREKCVYVEESMLVSVVCFTVCKMCAEPRCRILNCLTGQ